MENSVRLGIVRLSNAPVMKHQRIKKNTRGMKRMSKNGLFRKRSRAEEDLQQS